jgi:uncharacterized protein
MANPLLDRVLPAELAERGQVIEFEAKVGEFERLVEVVDTALAALDAAPRPAGWAERAVTGRLAFGWLDADRQMPSLAGRATTVLGAVCQRCLEPLDLRVETEFGILFADRDDDAADASGYETWTLEDGRVRLHDVVEESLVMALPLAPVHDSPVACGPLADSLKSDEPETVRPFADLRAQMKQAED